MNHSGRSWERSRERSRSSSRGYYTDDDDDQGMESEYDSGMVGDHERPVERFVKDGVAGGLRGMFWEFYQFWKKYRIR